MKFEDYEKILIDSLTDSEKIKMLPEMYQENVKSLSLGLFTLARTLIRHFAYWLEINEKLNNIDKSEVK